MTNCSDADYPTILSASRCESDKVMQYMSAKSKIAATEVCSLRADTTEESSTDELQGIIEQIERLKAEFPSDALNRLNELLGRLLALPIKADGRDHITALTDIAFLYYAQGEAPQGGLSAILMAARVATDRKEPALLRRALSIQGAIQNAAGDTAGALHSQIHALEIAESLQDRLALAAVWANLAITVYDAALYSDAKACYEKAEALALSLENDSIRADLRSRSLLGIALCCKAVRDEREGVVACERAIPLVMYHGSSEQIQSAALLEATYISLLTCASRLDDAVERLALLTSLTERTKSVRTEVATLATRGLLEVRLGRTHEGIKLLDQALHLARGLPSSYVETLKSRVLAFDYANQPDRALTCLQELLAHNQAARSAQIAKSLGTIRRDLRREPPNSSEKRDADIDKAVDLSLVIDARLETLLNTCVTAGLRCGHDHFRVFRMGALAERFAISQGLSDVNAKSLGLSAQLCDLGMIVIPDSVLTNPNGLSANERILISEHTHFGAEVLAKSGLRVTEPCIAIAKLHHERWDGAGPWKLAKSEIPLEAAMVCLCDSFDSLVHARPWRPPFSPQEALAIIRSEAGTKFHPELTDRFVNFVEPYLLDQNAFEAVLTQSAFENTYVQTYTRLADLLGLLVCPRGD